MKKSHLLLLVIFASCTYFQNKQQQAEGLAKKYLDSALKGSDKYEIVSTGKIDTLRGRPNNEPEYQLITRKIDRTYKIEDSISRAMADTKNSSKISELQNLAQTNHDKQKILLEQGLTYFLNYKGKPEGWIIQETYKLKKGGDSSLYIATFKIDDKLSKVLSQQITKK